MAEEDATLLTARITEISKTPWSDLADPDHLARGIEGWFWCDVSGAHRSNAPPTAFAGALMLWGWGPRAWLRLRANPTGVHGARLEQTAEGVVVARFAAKSWRPGTGRAVVADDDGYLDLDILEPRIPHPPHFLAVPAPVVRALD